MKRGGKMSLCLLGILTLTPALWAVVNDPATAANTPVENGGDQPYNAIWVRNVFDLKPPPPPVEPPKANLPPSNIKLLGIFTILGPKRALISMQQQIPGKPPSKEQFYTMAEGERHDELELLEIDPKARTVKIKNEENISTITFETNKPSGPASAPQNMAGGGVRPPAFQPPNFNPPGNSLHSGGTPLPPRTVRPSSSPDFSQSPQNNYGQPNYGASAYSTGYSQGGGAAGLSLPNAFNQGQSSQNQNNSATPSVPLEVSAAMLALQTQALEAKGFTLPPPPPPLAIPESLQNSGNGSSQVPAVPTVPAPPLGSRTTIGTGYR